MNEFTTHDKTTHAGSVLSKRLKWHLSNMLVCSNFNWGDCYNQTFLPSLSILRMVMIKN